jgi:hypothetical protein
MMALIGQVMVCISVFGRNQGVKNITLSEKGQENVNMISYSVVHVRQVCSGLHEFYMISEA